MDDLLNWSCRPDETWGVSISNSSVELAPPLDQPGSKALEHGEQLVFTRRLEGRIGRTSYVEALQKFTHIFGLHYLPERDAYCRIDKHGAIALIRIVSVPSKDEWGGGRYVTFDRRLLDEYMFLTNTSLVRLFDFTRTQGFGGWSDACAEQRVGMIRARWH